MKTITQAGMDMRILFISFHCNNSGKAPTCCIWIQMTAKFSLVIKIDSRRHGTNKNGVFHQQFLAHSKRWDLVNNASCCWPMVLLRAYTMTEMKETFVLSAYHRPILIARITCRWKVWEQVDFIIWGLSSRHSASRSCLMSTTTPQNVLPMRVIPETKSG